MIYTKKAFLCYYKFNTVFRMNLSFNNSSDDGKSADKGLSSNEFASSDESFEQKVNSPALNIIMV